MQLTEHRPGQYHYIRRVAETELTIDDVTYQRSLVIGARLLRDDWPVRDLADLNASTIEPLLEHAPELVILGYGSRPAFPAPAVQRLVLERGIGLEVMTLDAACRTFNVLMSENRRAIAGLILPNTRT